MFAVTAFVIVQCGYALQLALCWRHRSAARQWIKLQQLAERLEKTAVGYAMEISSNPTKAIFSSTASSQDYLSNYGWMEKRWQKWTCSSTYRIHQNQRRNINKGVSERESEWVVVLRRFNGWRSLAPGWCRKNFITGQREILLSIFRRLKHIVVWPCLTECHTHGA